MNVGELSRKKVMARQCQLLTGSYSGATRSCNCRSPVSCNLTDKERDFFRDDSKVKIALERNRKEFESLNTEEEE